MTSHKITGPKMAAKNGNGNGNAWVVPAGLALTVIMALFQGFWGVAYSGLVSNQTRIEDQTRQAVTRIENQFLRLREYEEFIRREDANIKRLEDRMDTLSPRAEIDARLATNSNALSQVRGEVDILKRDLGQTYSIKDALAAMQARIDRMEMRVGPKEPSRQ